MLRSHWRAAALLIGMVACVLGFVMLVLLGPLISTLFENVSIQNIQWSPDGAYLALEEGQIADSDYRYQLYVLSRDGENLWRVTERGSSIIDYDWSPDSARIAIIKTDISNWGIFIAEVEGRRVRELVADSGRSPALDWSPDGASLAYWSVSPPGLYLVDAGDGTAQMIFQPEDITYSPEIAWSPDGNKIAFLASGTVYIIDRDGALLAEILDEENRASSSLTWDGDSIQFSTPGGVYEADASGGDVQRVGELPSFSAGQKSPDGQLQAKSGCAEYITLDIAPCDEIELLVISTEDGLLQYKLGRDDFNRTGSFTGNAGLLATLALVFLFGGPALSIPWLWHRGGCFRQALLGLLVGGLFVVVAFGLLILLG